MSPFQRTCFVSLLLLWLAGPGYLEPAAAGDLSPRAPSPAAEAPSPAASTRMAEVPSPSLLSPSLLSPSLASPAPGVPSAPDTAPQVPDEPSLLAAGQEALRKGDLETAIQRFRQAAAAPGDLPESMEARYLLAHTLYEADRPAEALEAFRVFLAQDGSRASPRLIRVAGDMVRQLEADVASLEARTRLHQLERELRRLSYAERLARIQGFLASGPPESLARRAHELEVEEAWAARDWTRAIRTLEALGADAPGAEVVFHEQLVQARQELRRTRGAWFAGAALSIGLVGGILLRPWRRMETSDRRPVALLSLHWSGMVWLVYGIYQLGRRPGDVAPVTIDRFLLLWGVMTAGLLLGVAWNVALRPTLTPARLPIASLLFGGTFSLSALYLFCYGFDYLPALGL